jgi:GMP reductase
MKIINETKLDFDDVLIKPKRSKLDTRKDVWVYRSFTFPYAKTELSDCCPLVASNMDTTGSFYMADTMSKLKAITCLNKHYEVEQYLDYYRNNLSTLSNFVFYSTGTSDSDLTKLDIVFEATKSFRWSTPNICVDVANGYSEKFVKVLSKIRNKYPKSIIMAGNVVTPEMTEELIMHGGVDIVKVGIGSGSVCTTRLKTGIGYPQLSAIIECADAAHGVGGHICSDGGCRTPADICKAFGGGADFVMLGSMLAGTNECDGEWTYEYLADSSDLKFWQSIDPGYPTKTRKKFLKFYGMSSKEAQQKYNEGVAEYRTSEGRCVEIPYKGTADEVMKDILGGIRSACTYVGSFGIKDLSKNTTFIKVNNTHNRIYEK